MTIRVLKFATVITLIFSSSPPTLQAPRDSDPIPFPKHPVCSHARSMQTLFGALIGVLLPQLRYDVLAHCFAIGPYILKISGPEKRASAVMQAKALLPIKTSSSILPLLVLLLASFTTLVSVRARDW